MWQKNKQIEFVSVIVLTSPFFSSLSLNNKLRNACGSTQTPPCGWPSSGSFVLSIRALKTSSTTGFSNQQTTDGMASSWMKNAFCESILSQSAKVSQRWRWRLLHQINFYFFLSNSICDLWALPHQSVCPKTKFCFTVRKKKKKKKIEEPPFKDIPCSPIISRCHSYIVTSNNVSRE